MHNVTALIFAGGRVPDLAVLTDRRAKAAVVVGGRYRCIDFALSNLAAAGVRRVGVLAQYRPSSLMDHVGSGMAWDLVGTDRGLRFLPPYLGPDSRDWYRGPADALYQNIDFIERNASDHVLLVSGDHVSRIDYRPLLDFHREHDADLSMAFRPVADEEASRFGIGELNASDQIVGFREKPQYPRSNLASISVYLFKRQVLVDELRKAVSGGDDATFEIHEVLARMIPRHRAYGWVFHGEWYYTRTLDEYVAFHQRLLDEHKPLDLEGWQVRSNFMARRSAPWPPARVCCDGEVHNSLISGGCVISGRVDNSVLSPGVRVAAGAVVKNSILWDDVVVEKGAVIDGVVSDKRARFGKGCRVGGGEVVINSAYPSSLRGGTTVVGMDVAVPAKVHIGSACILGVGTTAKQLNRGLASGQSLLEEEVAR